MVKKVVAVILRNKSGEILLQKRTEDYRFSNAWTLFGGAIEEETPLNAVKREINEELGVNVEPIFLEEYEIPEEKVFLFTALIDDLSEIRLREGNGMAFFSAKEITELNCPNKEIIKKWS